MPTAHLTRAGLSDASQRMKLTNDAECAQRPRRRLRTARILVTSSIAEGDYRDC